MEFFNVVKKVTKGAVNILASVADKATKQKAKEEKQVYKINQR